MLNISKGIQEDKFGVSFKNESIIESAQYEEVKQEKNIPTNFTSQTRKDFSFYSLNSAKFKFGDLRDEEDQTESEYEDDPFEHQQSFHIQVQHNKNSNEKPNFLDLYYLGIKFNRFDILLRNKNPYLFLHSLFLSEFISSLFTFVVLVVGSNFDAIFIMLFFLFIQSSVVTTFIILKNPPNEIQGKKCRIIAKISRLGSVFASAAIIIYGLIAKTPFNSLPLFLFGCYITGFLKCVAVALKSIPNELNHDCDNYQLRFFMNRLMQGFINSTGVIDVLSDIVLGEEIILEIDGKIKYLGIVIIVLCVLAMMIVYLRILVPEKITIGFHFVVVAVQIFILGITVFVVWRVWSREVDSQIMLVFYLSISTTVVNLAQQAFLIYDWMAFKYHENTQVHTSIIY
eukprot:TRINITY_DN11632_c0_g2_i1.p1 TRINITY_DN11632_c0_g2~~TRINITY_DN11632_c0_g2_i1.p1  ORF type:complete len:399 (+),score=29.42 TRINITY_DN11632_c0_g2_i1:188-1384(+)